MTCHNLPSIERTLFIDYAKDLSDGRLTGTREGIFERISQRLVIGRDAIGAAIVQTECFGGSFCVVCDRSTERTVELGH
jgi:hypothetical protein